MTAFLDCGRHLVLSTEPARLAQIARYISRSPVALARLEAIRRLTWNIPDAGKHQIR